MSTSFDLTLTFDNGPHEEVTPQVLEVLRRRAIRSTFFVIGKKIAGARKAAERAQAEGHWIGKHTWSHATPLGLLTAEGAAAAEIERAQDALGPLAHPRKLFRPMGGGGNVDARLLSAQAADLLQRGGFTCVLWNAIPRDWDDAEGWVDRALQQIGERASTLMVLHDIASGAMRHLDRFLGAAQERGARFRQDFPPECVPIAEGRAVRPLAPYMAQQAA